MKGLRWEVVFNMWTVALITIALSVLVVFQLHARSLTDRQTLRMSDNAARESSADSLRIEEGTLVMMVYTITIPESDLFIPSHFAQFISGDHELLPNLEVALTGMKQGEAKQVELTSDEAFGPYDAAKQWKVSKDRLPQGAEPGMVLSTEDGIPCILVEVSETMATIDFNHPLAGKPIVIDVRILDVTMLPDDESDIQPPDGVTGAPFQV